MPRTLFQGGCHEIWDQGHEIINMNSSGQIQDQHHGMGQHGIYTHYGHPVGAYGDQMIMQQHQQMHSGNGQGYL